MKIVISLFFTAGASTSKFSLHFIAAHGPLIGDDAHFRVKVGFLFSRHRRPNVCDAKRCQKGNDVHARNPGRWAGSENERELMGSAEKQVLGGSSAAQKGFRWAALMGTRHTETRFSESSPLMLPNPPTSLPSFGTHTRAHTHTQTLAHLAPSPQLAPVYDCWPPCGRGVAVHVVDVTDGSRGPVHFQTSWPNDWASMEKLFMTYRLLFGVCVCFLFLSFPSRHWARQTLVLDLERYFRIKKCLTALDYNYN